jgi:hypothetical protein
MSTAEKMGSWHLKLLRRFFFIERRRLMFFSQISMPLLLHLHIFSLNISNFDKEEIEPNS